MIRTRILWILIRVLLKRKHILEDGDLAPDGFTLRDGEETLSFARAKLCTVDEAMGAFNRPIGAAEIQVADILALGLDLRIDPTKAWHVEITNLPHISDSLDPNDPAIRAAARLSWAARKVRGSRTI